MALHEESAARASHSDDTDDSAPPHADDAAGAASRSLYDDLEALFTDGKTYLDAELVYQKSRAGFILNQLKIGIGLSAVAAFIAVLALIGLVVGLIIALTPLVTAWGATAIIVGLLLLLTYLILRRAIQAFRRMAGALSADTGPVNTGPVDTDPVDTGPVDTGPVDTGPADHTGKDSRGSTGKPKAEASNG